MRNTNEDYTLTERMMVVAILVLLAAIAIQNVLVSVKDSEKQDVKATRAEYAAVRNLYAGQNRTAPSVDPGLSATALSNTPVQ